MSAKVIAGVSKDQPFCDGMLVMPENVVATLQRFVLDQRTGNVTLSFRGGDLRVIKVEETATAK